MRFFFLCLCLIALLIQACGEADPEVCEEGEDARCSSLNAGSIDKEKTSYLLPLLLIGIIPKPDPPNPSPKKDDPEPQPEPPIISSNLVKRVSTSEDHSCAILANGGVICWGKGQTKKPTYFDPSGNMIASTAASMAVTAIALSTPEKNFILLENGNATIGSTLFAPIKEVKFSGIASGSSHFCGFEKDLLCWGKNKDLQFGFEGEDLPQPDKNKSTPIKDIKEIVANNNLTCALTDKEIQCWGKKQKPYQIRDSDNAHGLSLGNDRLCFIRGKKIRCSELNIIGNSDRFTESVNQDLPNEIAPSMVSVGYDHTCAISVESKGYCFGKANLFQLGNGSTMDTQKFTEIKIDQKLQQIHSGKHYSCAVTENGKVYCWGANDSGQVLPSNGFYVINTPTVVPIDEWIK